MTFYIGQKVVFVGYDPKTIRTGWVQPEIFPVKGTVYTVASLYSTKVEGLLQLILHEIPTRYGFRSDGFRPAVEKKTDISIFTEMLTKKYQPEDEQI